MRPRRRRSTTTAPRVDPVTASIIQGALENIAIEMGYKLMRMSYSSIIRESEDFGAAICDAHRPAALRVLEEHAAAVRPDPGLRARHHPRVRGARRHVPPGRRDHPQRPVQRRLARAGHRLLRADLPRRAADRLLDDDRAPSRHRLLPARQRRRRRLRRLLCRGPALPRAQGLRPGARATRRSGA